MNEVGLSASGASAEHRQFGDRRRRIVIVVSFMALGGAQLAALRLARGLCDRGHKVKIVALYQQRAVDSPEHVYDVLFPGPRPGPFDHFSIAIRLIRYMLREKPDCVLTFLPLANVAGQLVALLSGVRKRIVCHRFLIHTASPAMRRLDLAWAWLGVYTRIVAVSESVRATCSEYPSRLLRRSSVVYNGLRDLERPALTRADARRRYGLSDDEFVLLAVGRLSSEKNYHFMLRVVRQIDRATLLVAGDGPLRAELEAVIETGSGAKVRLLGPIPPSEIPDLLAAADVFLHPSIYEGNSNSVLEALRAGVPVAAADIPSQREVLVDPDGRIAGMLLPLDDFNPWVAAIERLRSDESARHLACEASLRRGRMFSYRSMVEGFEKAVMED